MVFGIFSRKPRPDSDLLPSTSPESKANEEPHPAARLPTPTPSTVSVTASARQSPLRFPTALRSVFGGSTSDLTIPRESEAGAEGSHGSPAPLPPITPSPPPPTTSDSKALYELMLAIPPKTLHAYTLSHLRPRPPLPSSAELPAGDGADSTAQPPSPATVGKLQQFFAALAPPPLLHCVRCHADFYAIENEEKDKACRVPHDDESALVSRVHGRGYETLWGCCGKTAEGDGGEGPPDGWCYEGRHTTDTKRARFRADSTIHDDKLTSCLRLNCRGIRDRLPTLDAQSNKSSAARKSNPSPIRSYASQASRKRPRRSLEDAVSASADEQENASERGRSRRGKSKQKDATAADDDTSMAVDDPPPKPQPKPKSRPLSRSRPSTNTSVCVLLSPPPPLPSKPASIAKTSSMATEAQKPKSGAAQTKPQTTSRTLVSQSQVHVASDSDTVASSRARPRTRSLAREQSRTRGASRARSKSAREPSQVRRSRRMAQRAAQVSDEAPDAGETSDSRSEDGDRDAGRGRKKRRTAA